MKKKKEVISIRIRDDNKWLVKKIEAEKKKTNSPSVSNTVETILIKHFS